MSQDRREEQLYYESLNLFGRKNSGGKKKRGGVSLLSRVEVSELRLWWTADPPRPFQFCPDLSSLPLGSGRGTSTPALFIDVFRPYESTGLRPFPRRLPELALLSPVGPSGLRLPSPGSSAAEAASDPDLVKPKLLRSFRPSVSVNCFPVLRPVEACTSWRLSPGIASPFRVALPMVRPVLAEPGLGDMLSTT